MNRPPKQGDSITVLGRTYVYLHASGSLYADNRWINLPRLPKEVVAERFIFPGYAYPRCPCPSGWFESTRARIQDPLVAAMIDHLWAGRPERGPKDERRARSREARAAYRARKEEA